MPNDPSVVYKPPYAEPPTDLTPLGIILRVMHQRYDDKDYDGAVALAKIAAPYLHPRVPSSAQPTDLTAMHDADLDALRPEK